MLNRMCDLVHRPQFRHFFVLSLLLLIANLFIFAPSRPARGNSAVNHPVFQEEVVWCFSPIVDAQRGAAYYLIHPEGAVAETLLEDYGIPAAWEANLSDPLCFPDWQEAANFRQEVDQFWEGYDAEERATFDEAMQKLYGKPVVWAANRPVALPTDRALEVEIIWCYTFFQPGESDEGVFLGHFAGLEPDTVLNLYATTLDTARNWQFRGSECFPSWQQAFNFTKPLTKTITASYTGESNWGRTVMSAYGIAWPAHRLLAPSRASALLDPDAKPVWCRLIFTGGSGSTVTFNHYPDTTTEEVLEFYNPPDWIRDLAGQETTECYISWEAAFRAMPFEWKKALLPSLPDNPGEADYEVLALIWAFSDMQWQEYQRAEFSAAGTPNPLMLTRVAPRYTATPTPTPTIDARAVSRDSAVWCFTHVEDLSHEIVFYMGHPPDMDYNGIRQAYNLPPGLLSQPDRETYCYENWPQAAFFARGFFHNYVNVANPPENSSAEQIQEHQNLIKESFGTLYAERIINTTRYEGAYEKPDQPVWCFSYFNKTESDSGIYLGHYVTEGDESILSDYGLDPSGGWRRVEAATQCFGSWNHAVDFYVRSLEQSLGVSQLVSSAYVVPAFITQRTPIPFSGEPLLSATPPAAVTPTPTATPTATRLPSGAGLLDTSSVAPVWCYSVFTGGDGSTISFGHYPGMSSEEVITLFNAPDWVKNLAGQEETNCHPSWQAAFEHISPPELKPTLSSYVPNSPSESDYELVILWFYFQEEWQEYQRAEFSADGTPQPVILTRMAPATSPTPTPPSDEPIWCFTLYYDDTPKVRDQMFGHYPDMDEAAIAAMHNLSEDYLNERPGRKTACFYSYTDAVKFQRAAKGEDSMGALFLQSDEAENQRSIERRYLNNGGEDFYRNELDHAKQVFDEGLFTQPRNQDATLPASDPDALLLDTDNPPVWCITHFRQGDQLAYLRHYPDMDVEEIKWLYFATELLEGATIDERLCFNSWEAAAEHEGAGGTSQFNEADFEKLVLRATFSNLWSLYRRPQFSPSVTPQVMTPVPTPMPDNAASDSPRWCRTSFVHPDAVTMIVGHYPDMDIEHFLETIEAGPETTTECYTSWRAAAEALPEAAYHQLNIPQSSNGESTHKDFELALLRYHFDQWLTFFWQEKFSADAPSESVTPVSFDDVVWCSYFLSKKNADGGRGELITLDNYPDMRVDEVLEAAGLSQDGQDPYLLTTIFCYDSWEKALGYLFSSDDVDVLRLYLPEQLNDGDYELIFLWFSFRDEWQDYQRSEFSADDAPQQAVIDFVEVLVERFNE